MQGEIINDSGTMTGGGGRPRGGRLRLGSGAPKPLDTAASASELAAAEQQEQASLKVTQSASAQPFFLRTQALISQIPDNWR